ncbi:MAG: hypothetical protein KIT16_12130 [Rhodospirillaceae bacterium]|nr:hypothetical protein [Rhodospirillaceae bacterium]
MPGSKIAVRNEGPAHSETGAAKRPLHPIELLVEYARLTGKTAQFENRYLGQDAPRAKRKPLFLAYWPGRSDFLEQIYGWLLARRPDADELDRDLKAHQKGQTSRTALMLRLRYGWEGKWVAKTGRCRLGALALLKRAVGFRSA